MQDQSPHHDARRSALRRLLTRENLIALAIFLALIALVTATADSAPQWIYQGF